MLNADSLISVLNGDHDIYVYANFMSLSRSFNAATSRDISAPLYLVWKTQTAGLRHAACPPVFAGGGPVGFGMPHDRVIVSGLSSSRRPREENMPKLSEIVIRGTEKRNQEPGRSGLEISSPVLPVSLILPMHTITLTSRAFTPQSGSISSGILRCAASKLVLLDTKT